MPPRKRTSPMLHGFAEEDVRVSPTAAAGTSGPNDTLALANEAEAEAAEAAALAARARARALTLRRQAEQAGTPRAGATRVDSSKVDAIKANTTDTSSAEKATKAGGSDADAATIGPPESTVITGDLAADELARRRLRVPRVRVSWLASALVVLCSLGFMGTSGYLVWHHRQVAAENQRSADFAAAARQGVVTLMSLNFNHAAADVKRILDNTTGDLRKDFELQSEQFAKSAQESKVITQATVNATAVQSMTNDAATVLVVATTNASNSSEQPRPRSWRLRVDIARDGGQLKLARVEFVP